MDSIIRMNEILEFHLGVRSSLTIFKGENITNFLVMDNNPFEQGFVCL